MISFTAILLFATHLLKLPLINYFDPLLTAFKKSFKDKYHYWIGVSIIFRDLFLAMQAVPTRIKLILSTILVIIFSLLLGSTRPYKNKLLNIQELFLLLNLTIVYAVSYQENGNLFSVTVNVMISLAFIQFCVIILYHLLAFTCCHKILRIIQHYKLMKLKL